MATMNISLPDPMKEFVEAQARKAGFGTVSEYFHAMIQQEQRREAKLALESLLAEGLESGPAEPMTDADWDFLRSEVRRRRLERQCGNDGQEGR